MFSLFLLLIISYLNKILSKHTIWQKKYVNTINTHLHILINRNMLLCSITLDSVYKKYLLKHIWWIPINGTMYQTNPVLHTHTLDTQLMKLKFLLFTNWYVHFAMCITILLQVFPLLHDTGHMFCHHHYNFPWYIVHRVHITWLTALTATSHIMLFHMFNSVSILTKTCIQFD